MHTRALLNATTTASVSAAGDPADTLTSCVVRARGFLWISSALLLLAGASAALYYAWLKKKKTSGRGHGPGQPTHARLHCALLWPGGVLVGGWGVMGVVLSTSSRYCDPEETKSALVTLSTAVASACLLVSIGLLTNAVFASIRAMVPGQETPPAIVCLRCSCCSRVFKRLLVLAPALLLAAVNLVSWSDSRQPRTTATASCGKSNAPTFFGGATVIFLTMILVQLLSYGFSSSHTCCQRRRNGPSTAAGLPSPTTTATGTPPVVNATPRISRKHQRRVVFAALLILSLTCIAWAVLGWRWMAQGQSSPPPDSASASPECAPSESVVRSMGVSIVLLLLIGWSLLTLTLCCRLEDVVLASSEVPTVDVSLLSPTLLRSPKAVQSLSTTSEQPSRAPLAAASLDAVV